jgi:hypothetical protein
MTDIDQHFGHQQVADVQIHRHGKVSLSKGTGILHLTAHHLIYTYTSPTDIATDATAKAEEFWVRSPFSIVQIRINIAY